MSPPSFFHPLRLLCHSFLVILVFLPSSSTFLVFLPRLPLLSSSRTRRKLKSRSLRRCATKRMKMASAEYMMIWMRFRWKNRCAVFCGCGDDR